MLAPPTSSEALASLDPTRIKNRQFSRATGREAPSKDTSLWTETPAEKQKRLEEELSGKRKRATAIETTDDETEEARRKRRKMQEELSRKIEDHTVSAPTPWRFRRLRRSAEKGTRVLFTRDPSGIHRLAAQGQGRGHLGS